MNVDSNEAEDSEVVDKWEEQVRKEQADRDRDGHQERGEKASGSRKGTEGENSAAEDSDDGEVIESGEQDCGDVRQTKKLIDPKMPSKVEVEDHEMTHLSFRSWCRHCVKGRGVESAHRKVKREDGGLPEIHVDFAFPNSKVGIEGLIVVFAQERSSLWCSRR